MTDKTKFEAWMRKDHPSHPLDIAPGITGRYGVVEYISAGTQHKWLGWQASRIAALEEAAKVAKGHKIEGYVPPEDGSARDYYNAAGEDIATAILKLDNSGSASVGGGQGS